MPFTQRRYFGDQVHGAGAQHVVVDAEPDVQDAADQRGVERHRHALDQPGHHGCYRRHVAGLLRIDAAQRDDEADHGADQAQQDEAGGQMADDRDAGRQLEAEVAGKRGAAAAVPALYFGDIARSTGVGMKVEILAGIELAAGTPDLAGGYHETNQKDAENQLADSGAVGIQDRLDPSLEPRRRQK